MQAIARASSRVTSVPARTLRVSPHSMLHVMPSRRSATFPSSSVVLHYILLDGWCNHVARRGTCMVVKPFTAPSLGWWMADCTHESFSRSESIAGRRAIPRSRVLLPCTAPQRRTAWGGEPQAHKREMPVRQGDEKGREGCKKKPDESVEKAERKGE